MIILALLVRADKSRAFPGLAEFPARWPAASGTDFAGPTAVSFEGSTIRVASMELTHVDAAGAARMVDVTAKDVTARTARARGRLRTTPDVIGLLRRDGLPKGDALAVARIAGIAGAKRTADLIPLCHPIPLHGVIVDLELEDDAVTITATTRTTDRTGVEMEALTAVATAGLTLYDMIKSVDRSAVLSDIRLLAKAGGRTGSWEREPA